MNYNELKSSVRAVIKENGNEEITGDLLQDVLIAIINTLGLGYQYIGVGTTATDPGVPDARVMYLCTAAGTYTNFGTQFTLDGSKIAICTYDQEWNVDLLDIPTSAELSKYLKIADLATGTGDSEVTSMTQKAITQALLGCLKIADLATGTGDSEVTSMTQKAITEALATKEDKSNKVISFSHPTDEQYPSAKLVSNSLGAIKARAGIAEGLADTISAGTAQEFLQRQSGGDGVNCIKRIKGKTIAWNQLCDLTLFNRSSGATYNDVTARGAVISATTSGDKGFLAPSLVPSGYKVLLSMRAKPSESGVVMALFAGAWQSGGYVSYIFTDTNWHNLTAVLTTASSGNIGFYLANATAGQSLQIEDCVAIDLTLLYGSEISGMTDAQILAKFQSEYPELYYAPASVLKSNDAAALLTDGRNQWDGVLESGYWDANTGEPKSGANWKRSKNPIKAFPNTEYYWKATTRTGSSVGYLVYYDAGMNYIGSSVGDAGQENKVHTTPANCRFIHFYVGVAYEASDICINLSDASFNGTYEPYWKRVLALRLSELTGIPEGGTEADRVTIFPEGAAGAGSAFDSIFVENGVTKARKTMLAEVDLGDPAWTRNTLYDNPYFEATITGIKANASATNIANIVCSKYATREAGSSSGAVGIAQYDTKVRVFDSAYTDAATFKAAMAGVKLIAEAATPIVYTDLQYADGTPFTMPATILVDNYGTERIQAPEGATTPSAPFCCDSNYSIGIANLVKKLSEL